MVVKSASKTSLNNKVSQIVNVRIGDTPKKKKKRKRRVKKVSTTLGQGSIAPLFAPRVIYATPDQSQIEQQKFQTKELESMLKLTQGELTNVKQQLLEYKPAPPVIKDVPKESLEDAKSTITGKSFDFSDVPTIPEKTIPEKKIPPPVPMRRSTSAPSVKTEEKKEPLLEPLPKPSIAESIQSQDLGGFKTAVVQKPKTENVRTLNMTALKKKGQQLGIAGANSGKYSKKNRELLETLILDKMKQTTFTKQDL